MAFGTLWLPVIVSAVVVFLVSWVLHMALKYHRADYRRLPDEAGVRAALGKAAPSPGLYMTPYCEDPKQANEPAHKELFVKGPVALLSVAPNGMPNMGKHLGLWFGLSLLVSFLTAYVARKTMTPATDTVLVLRVTAAVAFGCYGIGPIIDSIWKWQPWGNTIRAMIDALVYAIATGLVFMWLWPAT
jgi:hypothetical protein